MSLRIAATPSAAGAGTPSSPPPPVCITLTKRPASGAPKPTGAVSVDERHPAHRDALVLGVHHDRVPNRQDDRLVVGVRNPTLDEHLHVAPLARPAQPGLRVPADHPLVLELRHRLAP